MVRVIRLLKDLHIIMRAGVSEFTFVHFKYVIPWMISTYNLKRLEKESVGSVPYKLMKIAGNDTDASATTLKRNRDNADDADAEPAANIAKPADSEPMPSTSRASRIEKITIRKGDGDIVTSVVETNPRYVCYLIAFRPKVTFTRFIIDAELCSICVSILGYGSTVDSIDGYLTSGWAQCWHFVSRILGQRP